MRDLQKMTSQDLEQRAQELLQEQNAVMKELIRRGWGRDLPGELEHPDMVRTEDDF